MTLASRIAAHSRKPTATVYIGGRRWRTVLSLSRNQQYGQGISGGEVLGRDPPVTIVEGETTISWSWGYDGYEVQGFTGVVSRILQRSYPNQWQLQVADPLWLADIRRKDYEASPLNNCPASDAIEQFLGACGITRMSIPSLAASGSKWAGSEWVMGTLTPVAFANTTALQACRRICETLGYWLYADASGVVRAVLMERRPSDSPTRTLKWGVDFLIAGPPERERDASAVKNRTVVRGANTGVQGAQIWDEWQTGDGDRSLEVTYDLIEYVNEAEAGNASCTAAAKRLLRLWSRQPNVIRIPRLKADPRLAVGQTVAVQCALIGYSGPMAFFIYGLQTSLDLRRGDFAQSLILDGGTGSQGYTTLLPPVASFSFRLVKEGLNGVGVVEVFLDGSGSASMTGGEIVAWAWTTATATQTGYPSSATGVRAMFVYPATTTTASITLTVTDTSSKTGSITQTISLAGDALNPLTSRVISLALGSAWAVSPDGGQTWAVEASGDSTLVPESGGQTLLSTRGTGSTGLRGTRDNLATASQALASLGGAIAALSVNEAFPLRVWAGVGTALKRSTDGGTTFAAWGTLPASIAWVLEDPYVGSSVFVLAGANLYHSTLDTPGTSWVTLYAGPTGATGRQMVRGASGATTWIAYTGTFTGSPLQRVEGPLSVTWPLGTSPEPTEINSIALSTDELYVYAWDAQGRGWSVDSSTGLATLLAGAALGAGETAMPALYDPDDAIIYLPTFGATAGTTYKYFPLVDMLGAFYVPASGQQSHRVGLGQPSSVPVRVIVASYGVSGAGDGFHVRDETTGTWTLKTPPYAAGYWYALEINPSNPLEWLAVGNTQVSNYTAAATAGAALHTATGGHDLLYYSADGGATWAPIVLTAPVTDSAGYNYGQVCWTGINGGWVFAASSYTAPRKTAVWYGAGSTAGAATLIPASGTNSFASDGFVAGMGGDLLLAGHATNSGAYASRRWVVATDGASSVPSGTAPGVSGGPVVLPGTRRAAFPASGDLWGATDYRAAQPAALGVAITGGSLAPLADGSILVAGGATLQQINDPFGAATVADVAGAASVVVSDGASRSVAAAHDGTDIQIYDGAAWVGAVGPGVAISALAVIRVGATP